jgi:general stress protein 26
MEAAMADKNWNATGKGSGKKGLVKSTATDHPEGRKSGVPHASRPQIPAVYGIPKHNKGLLPWSYVSERMVVARVYWITTVDANGRPHATPVDGVWLDDRLYFGGSPETRRNRNLARNPAVCVHLESGSDVLILHGEAKELGKEDRELAQSLVEVANEKYGYSAKAEDYLAGGTYAFAPRKVIAWEALFKNATRWEF